MSEPTGYSQKLIAKIQKEIPSGQLVNLDVIAGWKAGISRLKRLPPEHFGWRRCESWYAGFDAGKRQRWMCFVGITVNGDTYSVRRSGWGHNIGKVLAQMEKHGCYGDVNITWFDGADMAKETETGI